MTNLLDNWEEKIKRARGYNVPEGESYIVFDEENEIWDSEYLAKFISSLLQAQRERDAEIVSDFIRDHEGNLNFPELKGLEDDILNQPNNE